MNLKWMIIEGLVLELIKVKLKDLFHTRYSYQREEYDTCLNWFYSIEVYLGL